MAAAGIRLRRPDDPLTTGTDDVYGTRNAGSTGGDRPVWTDGAQGGSADDRQAAGERRDGRSGAGRHDRADRCADALPGRPGGAIRDLRDAAHPRRDARRTARGRLASALGAPQSAHDRAGDPQARAEAAAAAHRERGRRRARHAGDQLPPDAGRRARRAARVSRRARQRRFRGRVSRAAPAAEGIGARPRCCGTTASAPR